MAGMVCCGLWPIKSNQEFETNESHCQFWRSSTYGWLVYNLVRIYLARDNSIHEILGEITHFKQDVPTYKRSSHSTWIHQLIRLQPVRTLAVQNSHPRHSPRIYFHQLRRIPNARHSIYFAIRRRLWPHPHFSTRCIDRKRVRSISRLWFLDIWPYLAIFHSWDKVKLENFRRWLSRMLPLRDWAPFYFTTWLQPIRILSPSGLRCLKAFLACKNGERRGDGRALYNMVVLYGCHYLQW